MSTSYILASQAEHVYYNMAYPSKHLDVQLWCVACKIGPRREFVTPLSERNLQENEEGNKMYQDDHDEWSLTWSWPWCTISINAVAHIIGEVEMEELHALRSIRNEEMPSSELESEGEHESKN